MSALTLEIFLAKLYTDAEARERFLRDPAIEAAHAELDHAEITALCAMDFVGLQMAAASYACKRDGYRRKQKKQRWPWLSRLLKKQIGTD